MFCPNIVHLGTYVRGPILGLLCFYIWSKYFYKGISKVLELFFWLWANKIGSLQKTILNLKGIAQTN
jgi:hypothetical protein